MVSLLSKGRPRLAADLVRAAELQEKKEGEKCRVGDALEERVAIHLRGLERTCSNEASEPPSRGMREALS